MFAAYKEQLLQTDAPVKRKQAEPWHKGQVWTPQQSASLWQPAENLTGVSNVYYSTTATPSTSISASNVSIG